MKLWFVAFGALALWALFGDPNSDFAGWFWPDRPAPWEEVDAYYYPNRRNLSVHRTARNVGSLDGCRAWVRAIAEAHDDPRVSRGDYECAIGKLRNSGDLAVYRITAR